MSRGSGRKAAEKDTPTDVSAPETEVDPSAPIEEQDAQAADLVEQDPYDKLDGQTPEEAVRGAVGAPDQYPYLDKTAMPLHERNLPMTTADGPSQSDLNPAFTPKPEDGGPSKERDGEQVIEGTEPNMAEQRVAAAENSGQDGAVEAVEKDIAEGEKQQMDVDEVNKKGEERAPEGTQLGGTLGKAEGDGSDTAEPTTDKNP